MLYDTCDKSLLDTAALAAMDLHQNWREGQYFHSLDLSLKQVTTTSRVLF